MLSSLEYKYFIFRLAYFADIFQQLNEVNLKLQGQSSIATLSAFVEKLWQLSAKSSSRKFCYVRDCATAAGGEVNVDIASKFVQRLAGLLEEFVLHFPEIIKTTWMW